MTESALTDLDLPVARADPISGGISRHFTTDGRRWLQLALAALWLIAAVLQSQPFMFTKSFATQVLAPTALHNPPWLSDSILWSARLVEANPVWTNSVFAAVQLLLGLGIAVRRFVKPALAASIAWSLLVWWFGEGLGGLLLPGSNALGGAPGAAVLYAVLAVLLWPTAASTAGSFIASRPIGRWPARIVWLALWGGLAVLNLEPANLSPDSVQQTVGGMGAGEPPWLAALVSGFAGLSAHNGIPLTILGTVVLAFIAISAVLPPPAQRAAVVAAIVVSLGMWTLGEALGGIFGGQATDVDSGPLLVLIALSYWPSRC